MFNLGEVFQGLSKVILKGGVVGKVTGCISVFVVIMGIMAWSIGNVWLGLATLVSLCFIVREILIRLIDFAHKHPQAALLEGAEFIQHERLVHQSKDRDIIPVKNDHKKLANSDVGSLLVDPSDVLQPDIEQDVAK